MKRRMSDKAKKIARRALLFCRGKKSAESFMGNFLEEQNNFQLNMLGVLRLVIPGGQILYLISAFVSGFSLSSIIVTIFSMLFTQGIIFYALHWKIKSRPHIPLILTLVLLIWQLTTMEIIRELMKEMYLTPTTNIYVGIFMGVTNSFITVSGVKWQLMAIYYSTYALMWYVRMTLGDSRPESRYEQISFSAIMFSGVTFLFRKKQLLEYATYKSKREFEENLRNFKILIKEVLPEHILIVGPSEDGPSLLFLNDSARKRFRIRNEIQLHSILEKLKVDEIGSGTFNNMPEAVVPRKKGFLKNTMDLVQNMVYEEEVGSFASFQTFQVRLNEDSGSSIVLDLGEGASETPVFELKVGKTSWESSRNALILILTDITQMQRFTKLKLRHQKKDQFLSTFTHEIRTPINSIIGMVESALDMVGDFSEIKENLHIALCSAKALIFKVGDLLDLSAINSNNVQLKIEEVNLGRMVDEVVEINCHSIFQRGLKLIKDYKVSNEIIVKTDKLRFQQILMNLLTNAIKFTSSGFIRVGISEDLMARYQGFNMDEVMSECPRNGIMIEVEDSGKGIDEESMGHLFKLFEKFESVGKTTGVGLGLAVSQKLLSLLTNNSSVIEVNSTVGAGSTFFFNILKEHADIHVPNNTGVESSSKYFRVLDEESKRFILRQDKILRPRLLVVDDDPMNILVVENYLKSMGGYVYETAGNGAEAIEKIVLAKNRGEFFALILMDLNMPIMNGLEATKIIMNMIAQGEIPSTKIVALTANASTHNETLCLGLGMTDFLSKPLYKEDFKRKMQSYLLKPE